MEPVFHRTDVLASVKTRQSSSLYFHVDQGLLLAVQMEVYTEELQLLLFFRQASSSATTGETTRTGRLL